MESLEKSLEGLGQSLVIGDRAVESASTIRRLGPSSTYASDNIHRTKHNLVHCDELRAPIQGNYTINRFFNT